MNAERLLAHYERIADAPDAVPQLRRFILDLAVRGNLVLQDPNDEPASELLKRIAAEKARLVKAGKITKEKPLLEIEPAEIPFDVPRSWVWERIRKVTSDRGQKIPNQEFTYIDVTAINNEVGRIEGAKVTSAKAAPSRARKIVRKGDVLYSCVRPYLLNIAVVETEISPPPIASTAFAVLCGFGLVLPRYQWIVLRSPFMVECVQEKMRGQAYPAINDSDFSLLLFPLAPLAEQHRIIARVDELMALCDRLEAARAEREATRDQLTSASLVRLNTPDPNPANFADHARFALSNLAALTTRPDQINQLRQIILNLAVRGKLVPQDPNDEPASELLKRVASEIADYACANDISPAIPEPLKPEDPPFPAPGGWQWKRLCQLFKIVTDGDHQPPPKVDEGVAFLTIGNITTGRLDFSNCRFVPRDYFESLASYRTPKKHDILYTVVGATYGRPALVETDRDFCVQRHIAIMKPANSMELRFLVWLLASPLTYEQASQSTTGTAQPTIGLWPLRNFLSPVPPPAEQRRIVAKVDELMALCDRLEASLTAAADTRRRLLDALLAEALAPVDAADREAAE
jgi:type I restriction enzyme S subunit